MLHFTKGNIDTIVVTLTEKCTLQSPNYLWVCTSRTTNEVVKFVILGNTDLTNASLRFNKFLFTTNSKFANSTNGEWSYIVYEQTSTTNLDPTLATGIVEKGQLTVNDSTQFEFNTYTNVNNTYKVRDI
jgi:predicted GNAT superfamily acetyltransferase